MTTITTILWVLAAIGVGAVVSTFLVSILAAAAFVLAFVGVGIGWVWRNTLGRKWRTPRWVNEDTIVTTVMSFAILTILTLMGILALDTSETEIGWPDAPQWMNDMMENAREDN